KYLFDKNLHNFKIMAQRMMLRFTIIL
ncbi:hypothetical protein Tsp_10176, partial [Trichinella spiralis]